MSKDVIVRMPPSPTGPLHLGTARTALFNWLFAKANDGQMIFRWEDTDQERSKKEWESQILEGLKWLGMDFEKEADVFCRQSERRDVHHEKLMELWEKEKIFPCFTTPDEVQALRDKANQERTNFVFWSPFRDCSKKLLQEKIDAEESFVWRLRVPRNEVVSYDDLIRGSIEVGTETLGDFAIARSDGSVLYMLANVTDDWTQGVTHILRGEDHISNTPKQILLYQALEAPLPNFGHIPLVLDHQKRKLSKRNVDPSICVLVPDFQEAGFVPEAVVNGLALLGWNPKTEQEIFSFEALVEQFSLEKVNPGAGQYNFEKMQWLNTQWIRQLDLEILQQHQSLFSEQKFSTQALQAARAKSRDLQQIEAQMEYLEADPGIDPTLLVNEKMNVDPPLAIRVLEEVEIMLSDLGEDDFTAEIIREKSLEAITRLELKNGPFLHPFRMALANRNPSAGPFDIAEVIGKAEAVKRVKRARTALS